MLVYVQGRIIKMIVYVQVWIKNDSLCTGGDNKLIVYVLEVIIKC